MIYQGFCLHLLMANCRIIRFPLEHHYSSNRASVLPMYR